MPKMIERIRRLVAEQRSVISSHANEEMSDDDITSRDIESAVLSGQIVRRFTRDPRGTRYEIAGPALDGRQISIICRILADGSIRIITAYLNEREIE